MDSTSLKHMNNIVASEFYNGDRIDITNSGDVFLNVKNTGHHIGKVEKSQNEIDKETARKLIKKFFKNFRNLE